MTTKAQRTIEQLVNDGILGVTVEGRVTRYEICGAWVKVREATVGHFSYSDSGDGYTQYQSRRDAENKVARTLLAIVG